MEREGNLRRGLRNHMVAGRLHRDAATAGEEDIRGGRRGHQRGEEGDITGTGGRWKSLKVLFATRLTWELVMGIWKIKYSPDRVTSKKVP